MIAEGLQKLFDLTKERTPRFMEIKTPIGNVPFLTYPGDGGSEASVDVRALAERWLRTPLDIDESVSIHTVSSFVEIVDRHRDEASVIFVRAAPDPSMVAIIDYHEKSGAARNLRHRIVYEFPFSPEWLRWAAHNGTRKSIAEFAAFIEDNIQDIADPDDTAIELATLLSTKPATPNAMLSLSRGLELHINHAIKEIRNLTTGEVSIQFDEEHTDAYGGPIKIPGVFSIRIPLFEGSEPINVPVRLRYARHNNSIAWTYHLWRQNETVRHAIAGAVSEVQAALPDIAIYWGEAPEKY